MLKRSARAIPPFNLGYKSRAVGSLHRGESTECDRQFRLVSVSGWTMSIYTFALLAIQAP